MPMADRSGQIGPPSCLIDFSLREQPAQTPAGDTNRCFHPPTSMLAVELRDEELRAIWGASDAAPIRYDNPLLPFHVIRHDVLPVFPRPGRYDRVESLQCL
jgi:hypothetical protein